MNNLIYSLNAVLPVFLLIVTGVVLKKVKLIDADFISKASKLVFKVALPVLIFLNISKSNFTQAINPKEIMFIIIIVSVTVLILFIVSGFIIKDGASRGVFIQGAFRSNIAIIGLAIIYNLFGEVGLTKSSILMLFTFPLYNIYAVLVLTISLENGRKGSGLLILKAIITNPLIIAALVALPFSIFNIETGIIVNKYLNYIARMTLPLALLGVGGSLSFHSFKKDISIAISASVIKIIIYPALAALILIVAGFRGVSLGAIFIILGAPTAVSSYVMAEAMGSNSELAANIILITTLGSIFTIGGGIFILKSLGYI
ncbi:MAG: AEC family transporter [Spirochaetaceae bacterium]